MKKMLEPMTPQERDMLREYNLYGAVCADLEYYGFTPVDDPVFMAAWFLHRLGVLPTPQEQGEA